MFKVPLTSFAHLFRAKDEQDDGMIPDEITCANCNTPLDCLTSYGITTPLNSNVRPGDFCNISCISQWAIKVRNTGGE